MGWCSQLKVDPFTASVAVVGDFLLHLFDQKLAISTLEGYRMAIGKSLRATSNVEVGRCDTLKALIRNLQIEESVLDVHLQTGTYPRSYVSFVCLLLNL